MKQKHIDASREVRLWISQIILPAVIGVAYVLTNQGAREWIDSKLKSDK